MQTPSSRVAVSMPIADEAGSRDLVQPWDLSTPPSAAATATTTRAARAWVDLPHSTEEQS
jgi:hypothetical protein